MKGRFNNQPFLNQPKPKLNQKPNHLLWYVNLYEKRFVTLKHQFLEKVYRIVIFFISMLIFHADRADNRKNLFVLFYSETSESTSIFKMNDSSPANSNSTLPFPFLTSSTNSSSFVSWSIRLYNPSVKCNAFTVSSSNLS